MDEIKAQNRKASKAKRKFGSGGSYSQRGRDLTLKGPKTRDSNLYRGKSRPSRNYGHPYPGPCRCAPC